MDKKKIRDAIRHRRQLLHQDERTKLSNNICDKVVRLEEMKNAETIACYIAKEEEVQTNFLIEMLMEMEKKVVIPKVRQRENELEFRYLSSLNDDFERGYMGILEPKDELELLQDKCIIDFAILPAVALDITGRRLGMGRGYFDRFFFEKSPNRVLCAIAFDFQIVDELPSEHHDVNIDLIVTDKRIIDCRGPRKLITYS